MISGNYKKFIIASLLLFPSLLFAQEPLEGLKEGFVGVDNIRRESEVKKFSDVEELVEGVVSIILAFVSILAVAVVIIGGVMYLLSGGDEAKAEKAKKLILAAVIGLIVIGIAGLLVNTLVKFFAAG